MVNLSGGVLSGLLLGVTAVFLRHRSDRNVHQPGVTQRYGVARELGVIPAASRSEMVIATRWIGRAQPQPGTIGMGDRGCLCTWLNPSSPVSESFRSVMTSLLFGDENAPEVRFFVVTSPGMNEGKTTVASNLSATLAATGRRTLLVDADLRRPRLHTMFGITNTPGLSEFSHEVLAQGFSDQLIERFTQQTTVPNLWVMPCGSCTSGESRLIHTLRFAEAFTGLRHCFDMVVVDAPPLLYVPETRVMARLADGAVLVVRAGTTRIDDVLEAERHIRQDGAVLLGTILNDAKPDTRSYGYYGRLST
jgi:capsular exopolysaccharide synthesis family protein